MRVQMIVGSLIGLIMAASAPSQAAIPDGLKNQPKTKLVAQAVTKPISAQRDDSPAKPPELIPAKPPELIPAQPTELAKEPEAVLLCKDLGLEWITPWKPKLATLRKLPAWADYVLSISETGEIQSAELLDASAKGIWELGNSKKVLGVLLAQKISPTGSALQCNETLYFYKNSQSRKIKMPESRCGQSLEFCVKN